MNWEALGAIGELIGAIAVVVTLIYLAGQLKQNTRAMQSGTRETFLNGLQTVNGYALQNSDVLHRGLFQREELSGEEFTRFLTIVHAALNAYEALYSEYLAGHVDEAFWESKARQIQFTITGPSGRKAWFDYTYLFDERFVTYVNEVVVPKIGADNR
jgi:hypothetical protein